MKLIVLAVAGLLAWIYRKQIGSFLTIVGIMLTWILIVAAIIALVWFARSWFRRRYRIIPNPDRPKHERRPRGEPQVVERLPHAVNMRLSPRPRTVLHPQQEVIKTGNVIPLDEWQSRNSDDVPAS